MPFRVLQITLIVKIAITLVVWSIPPLFFPVSVLQWLFAETAALTASYEALLFNTRLMGVAFFALLAGYAFGLGAIRRGEFPYHVVYVGLVSNGGATLLILIAALSGSFDAWPMFARAAYFMSGAVLFAITAVLVCCLILARRAAATEVEA